MSRARKSPPPALSGLIRQLPAGAWSPPERAMFLAAFTRCLDLSVPLNDGLVLDPAALSMAKVGTTDPAAIRGAQLSGAHADDLPDPETELAGQITYRSTGRGAYDVMQTRAEGPAVVLAMVQFSEGVRGRVHAMERFIASLRQTSQDVQP